MTNINTLNAKLLNAVINGKPNYYLQQIVDQGADVRMREDHLIGSDIYHKPNPLRILKWLIKQGSDPHAHQETTLRKACQRGVLPAVQYLLTLPCDVHAADDNAFFWAAAFHHWEIVSLLFEHGCEASLVTISNFVAIVKENQQDLLEKIIASGVSFHRQPEHINEILQVCILAKNHGTLLYLVKQGMNSQVTLEFCKQRRFSTLIPQIQHIQAQIEKCTITPTLSIPSIHKHRM